MSNGRTPEYNAMIAYLLREQAKANLSSSVDTRFRRFLGNIELTTSQKQDVAIKQYNVRKTLHGLYYTTDYNGSTSRIAGSHGKKTPVRPPSDIDLYFFMPSWLFERYDAFTGNKQSALLQDVKLKLQPSFPNTDLRGEGQVVSIPFVSFRVEVVPAFLLTNGRLTICDTNDGGSWKQIAPNEELAALDYSDTRSNGNTRNLIRMLKVWKRACNVPIKSLALELLAQSFLTQWQYFDKSAVYYDWMVRDYFQYLVSRAGGYEFMPGTIEGIALGTEWKSRAESAHARATKACEYEGAKDALAAVEEWKKIFGDLFQG